MSLAKLAAIATSLETDAGAATIANANESGYWKRIATALETIAGATTTASSNKHGYQKRAAAAFETIVGASNTANANENGYLYRMVLAVQTANGAVYTGSLINRLYLGVLAFTPGSIPDTTPDAFDLGDQTGATPEAHYASNVITVAGLGVGVSVAVTVEDGEYIKNGAAHTSAPGIAENGDEFEVHTYASASYSTAVSTTLTIGGVSDTFTVTTMADPGEIEEPDAPVLTQTSGDGEVPFAFSASFPSDLIIDLDYLYLSHRIDGGSWVVEDPVLVDSDFYFDYILTPTQYPWPLFDAAAAAVADGELIEVKLTIDRDPYTPVDSNIIGDEMVVPTEPFTVTAAPEPNTTPGSSHTFTNVPFLAGYPIVLCAAGPVTSATLAPSGGGSSTTLNNLAGGTGRVLVRGASTTIAAGNYDVTINHGASEPSARIIAGTLDASMNPTPVDTAVRAEGYLGGSPGTTSTTLDVPTDGAGVASIVAYDGASSVTWNNGTEIGDIDIPADSVFSAAKYDAGTVTPSASPSNIHAYAAMVAAAWEPA